jgi:serine/threonine-protein kinase
MPALDDDELPIITEELPARIGHYKILEPIAKGGMGLVLLAQHETLDRLAALKIMRPEFQQDRQFVDRFLREAKLAASVEHPNVVPVYDAADEDGYLYIALRYVDGGHAGRVLRECGRLTEMDALNLIIGACRGLEAIHEAGMIHRDIKPSNILLTKKGQPMIGDLGLARAVEKSDNLTHAGQALGTPSYMSPEQARGEADIDIRSDLYSLGVMLFALLTGKAPFKGSSIYETVAKVMYEPVPEPRQFAPELTSATRRVVFRAMEKDRGKRFKDPAEMLDALTEAKSELKRALKAAAAESSSAPTAEAAAPKTPPQPSAGPPATELPESLPPRAKRTRVYRGVVIEDDAAPDLKNAAGGEDSSSASISSMVNWVRKRFAKENKGEPLSDAADEGSSQGSSASRKKVRRFRGVDYDA